MKHNWRPRSKRKLFTKCCKSVRKYRNLIGIFFLTALLLLAKLTDGYLNQEIHDAELINGANQEIRQNRVDDYAEPYEEVQDIFDKIGMLREKGEIFSQPLDEINFNDIKRIFEIGNEILFNEKPELRDAVRPTVTFKDEDIRTWPRCITSIIGILKDKEYMFPCFDITMKNDLYEVLTYLSQEIHVCPDPENNERYAGASDEVDSLIDKPHLISNLLTLVMKHSELVPIQKRLSFFAERWNNVILQHQSRHLPKSFNRKILIHMGFASNLPKNVRSIMGNNDDVFDQIEQWSDIIAAVYGLGYDIILSSNENDLENILSRSIEQLEKCAPSDDLPDIIFTDIIGAKQIIQTEKNIKGITTDMSFYEKIKCRLRIIDSFGTEPWFNEPGLALKSGIDNDNGELGLPSMKQFLTKYPIAADNFWVGFAIHESTPVPDEDVKNAFIYGYTKQLAIKEKDLLQLLSKYYRLFVCILDDSDDLPFNITNKGILSFSQMEEFYDSMAMIVGLGAPYEGILPTKFISRGAFFMSPRYPADIGRPRGQIKTAEDDDEKEYFASKPSYRSLQSQVPFLEKEFNSSYQRLQDFNNLKDVERILQRESQQAKHRPFIPSGFSGMEMMNRLKYSIDAVDYCQNRIIYSWVDYSNLIPILAKPQTDCNDACTSKGLYCNYEMLSFVNQKRWMKSFWPKCKNFIKITSRSYWSLGYPAVNGVNCILQENNRLLGCTVPGEGENRRVCPCQKAKLYQKLSA